MPAGQWIVRVELEEYAAPLEEVRVGNSVRLGRTPYYRGAASVTLASGETVELRLE